MLTCTAKMQIIGSNWKMDIKLQGINMCLGERKKGANFNQLQWMITIDC